MLLQMPTEKPLISIFVVMKNFTNIAVNLTSKVSIIILHER